MWGTLPALDQFGLPRLASLYRKHAVIPNHVLNDLTPSDGVAILSRNRESHVKTTTPETIGAHVERDESQVLRWHKRDHIAFQEIATTRKREIGGEG
jgi:hypothetical protein